MIDIDIDDVTGLRHLSRHGLSLLIKASCHRSLPPAQDPTASEKLKPRLSCGCDSTKPRSECEP